MKAKAFLFLIAAAMLVFMGCSKDNNNPTGPGGPDDPDNWLYFGVKAATIVYSQTSGDDFKVIFDDGGKKFRLEEEGQIIIANENTCYILDPENKTYIALDAAFAGSFRVRFLFYGDDASKGWQYYPGFAKQSNKTIAGKNCSVYKWNDGDGGTIEWGGWSRITFLYKDGDDKIEAKSFSESVAPNSFIVPADYEKEY